MHIIMARLIRIKTLVVFSIYNLVRAIEGDPLTKLFEVNLYDQLPDGNSQLTTHCQSREDDFGNQTLSLNQSHSWNFYQNMFKTPRFFCHFWWNAKQQTFDVFNKSLAAGDCQCGIGGNVCSWIVKSDGFYFSPNRVSIVGPIGTIEKRFDWV